MENNLGLIELFLVSGLVLGWAFWQLASVKRDIRKDQQKERDKHGQ